MIGYDLETYAVPGYTPGKGVCVSVADETGGAILPFSEASKIFRSAVQAGEIIAGAFNAFDLAVLGIWGEPDMLAVAFEALNRGLIFDVQIAIALDAVAGGHLFKQPNGAPLPNNENGKRSRYSLRNVHWLLTGEDAKENADWRLRYGELDGTPIDQWPETARQYPIDDAINALTDAILINKFHPRNLGMIEGKTWTHLTHNCRASFAMHLATIWGMKVDVPRLEALIAKVEAERAAQQQPFIDAGILKLNKKLEIGKNTAELKRRVAVAYGATAKCPTCNGTQKVKSAKTGKPINCGECDASGLDLTEAVPRTPAEGIKTDADTLNSSSDETLEAFAEFNETAKVVTTYGPALLEGKKGPLQIRGNVVLETARASYEGVIQQMPKNLGLRECIEARPGYVFCSVDYNALELSTLAQVCLWLFGWSDMADAINANKDLHSMLAADMTATEYEDFLALVKGKQKSAIDKRFGAKAGNFGFGGLMGAAKFVLTQRRQKVAGHGSMCRLGGTEHVPCGSQKKLIKPRNGPSFLVCEACFDFSDFLKSAWLKKWREMELYQKWGTSIPGVEEGDGIIISPGTGFVRSKLNASQACNHPFQHLAAMGAKHALWKLTEESYLDTASPCYGSRVVIFAHDELIAELPEERSHEAALRMTEVMIAAMREFVPDVKIGAEPALMRRWYKAAAPAYDSNKRLIPWEPEQK